LGDTAPPLRPSSRCDGLVHPSQDATITAVFIPNLPPIAMFAVAATASAGQRVTCRRRPATGKVVLVLDSRER
jgi:hypothetical protein